MRSTTCSPTPKTLGAAALLVLAGQAFAQAYPTKPVTLIVPFPPGGTTDVLARALGEKLGQSLGQTVIVENKPGAGATLGADHVAKARPDGYMLLMGAVHHTIATSVYKKLPYSFERDFAPITTVALVPNVLVISETTKASDVKSLVALAKNNKFTYGSNGNGTAQHLIGTQFASLTQTELLHIPYKGSGPLITDLIGGQITMSFDTITPVLPHIKAGKLRPLAVTTAKRSTALPNVPTLDEQGLKGFDLGTWFGVLAPAATPKDIVARLSSEMTKIIASPDFRRRMEEIGAEPIGDSPVQMGQLIKADTERYGKLVKAANVTLD
mgnify:CR=1 FL=1